MNLIARCLISFAQRVTFLAQRVKLVVQRLKSGAQRVTSVDRYIGSSAS
jgi:hypothetical protein